jgi:hypothetical protein
MLLAQEFLPILCRAGSAYAPKHPRKVLLRFEATSHGNIQHPRLCRAQHLLCTFDPSVQDKLVRALVRLLAKHLRKMSGAQPRRFRQFVKSHFVFDLGVYQLDDSSQACGC